jgi:hypothetical protein
MLFGAKMVLCAAAGRLAAERSEADKPATHNICTIFRLVNIINQLNKYITFLFYNTKISDNNAESVPRVLVAF